MNDGVGRLLLTSELTVGGKVIPDAVRRTAFVIDSGHALTALHCARDACNGADPLWLRLIDVHHAGTIRDSVNVPMNVIAADTSLDAAVLALDRNRRAVEAHDCDFESLFAAVALPLGDGTQVHAQIRTEGFPRDARAGGLAFTGRVVDCEAKLSRSRAFQLHLHELGAAVPQGPGGHSGGPVLLREPDSVVEVVVGLVRSFPSDESRQYARGGTLLATRIQDLVETFTVVKNAQSNGKITRILTEALPRRQGFSADVRERYGPELLAAVADPEAKVGILVQGDREEISRLRNLLNIKLLATDDRELQKPAELAAALIDALDAKDVLNGTRFANVPLGRLQMLYHQEVGDWPSQATSCDAMLVNAALVTIASRRRNHADSLTPLARFLLTVVAECKENFDNPALAAWLQETGHQLVDAGKHYKLRLTKRISWVFIDLGREPPLDSAGGDTAQLWPVDVSATLYINDADPVSLPLRPLVNKYEPSELGLLRWLREIFGQARESSGPENDLVVDIAAPHHLLDQRIEHWRVVDIDGEYEPLADHCRPRLRWSQRQHVPTLQQAVRRRAEHFNWAESPATPPPELSSGAPALKRWLLRVRHKPWLLYARPTVSPNDLLRTLLREGCPYIVWHQSELSDEQRERLTAATNHVSPAARQRVLPETITQESPVTLPPAVVWDDPDGRDGHVLVRPRLQSPGG